MEKCFSKDVYLSLETIPNIFREFVDFFIYYFAMEQPDE